MKYQKRISMFIMLLIISIPFYTSIVFAEVTNDEVSGCVTPEDQVTGNCPIVGIEQDKAMPRAPVDIVFTGTVDDSKLDAGTILTYSWDFGDGSQSSEPHPRHTYTEPGEYIVTFAVTDSDGDIGMARIIVYVRGSNEDVVVVADVTPTHGSPPMTPEFYADVQKGNAPYTFLWEFDDGTTSEEQLVEIEVSADGEYKARVTVTDEDGDEGVSETVFLANAAIERGAYGQELAQYESIGDAGGQCLEKKDDGGALVTAMDNGVIKVLETITSILYLICTIMGAIDTVVTAIFAVIGGHEGGCCHIVVPGACGAMDGMYNGWKKVYDNPIVSGMCCIVQCGWCTGQKCFGLPAYGGSQGAESKYAIGKYGINPYASIYEAMACLCPTAMLYNMRKLKTVYDTYNCCIENTCKAGGDTQPCERFLSVAKCYYWEGALYSLIYKVILTLLIRFIMEKIGEQSILGTWINCIISLWNLANTRDTIKGVQDSIKWMTTTFDEPDCAELLDEQMGWDIADTGGAAGGGIGSPKISVGMEDSDGDGVYDSISDN